MRRCLAAIAAPLVAAFVGAASAHAAAPGVQVSILSQFVGTGPAAAAATNSGDVIALVGPSLVSVGANGQQKQKIAATVPGGAFGIPIGVAYDKFHQLYVALPNGFGPPPAGTIMKISPNGEQATAVPGSDGMVAPDGFGLDADTGDLYVTDIFGNGIWRIGRDGVAREWTTVATNPLLVLPDGVKVFEGAAFVSIEAGKILRIPINADGSAGTATVWAHVDDPGVFFDDMVLDDRTGDVYVTRLDNNTLNRITPAGVVTTIANHPDDGILGAANMTLIHVGRDTVIYLANGGVDFFGTETGGLGPALLKITIS
jgi:sugar lactone lactonase YvrE